MSQKLAMKDFLTFRPKEVLENKRYLFECQDEKSPTGSSLLVHLEATHAGIVNGNFRFYRPDRMQDSAHVWCMPGRPLKPVLVRHDADADPLGRVLQAKYVDLSYQYADEYPIVKDTIFYNTDAKKRVNLYDSVDWIVDHLMPLEDYRGLGFIELGVKITQPDAIRKVMNDEYLTVSVGFETDQAICSICHTDWAVDDRCEHKMGTKVDKKLGYLISGNFDYHEVSFINFPADPFAGTIDKGPLKDSLNQMFFMGLTIKDQGLRTSTYTDALDYTADIQVLTPEESKRLEGEIKQQGGLILLTGSISGEAGIPTQGAYGPSKGALHQMTRQMAVEYAQRNIRVNAVGCGTVDTPIVHASAKASGDEKGYWEMLRRNHPIGRVATADEVAAFFAFLASDYATFFTGAVLMMDGGYTAQ